MGIASFSPNFSRLPGSAVLLVPLQALVALFLPARSPSASAGSAQPPPHHMVHHGTDNQVASAHKTCGMHRTTARVTTKSRQTVAKVASPSRLKIVREFECGVGPTCAGRMVISGRMADVCAELDRMTQREATVRQT